MTTASNLYRDIVRKVLAELGSIGEVERRLVGAFAGSCVFADNMVAKHVSGEDININEYASIIANQFRMAQDLLTLRQINSEPLITAIEYQVVERVDDVWVTRDIESGGDLVLGPALPKPLDTPSDPEQRYHRRLRDTAIEADAVGAVEVELPRRPTRPGTIPRRKLKQPLKPWKPGEGPQVTTDEPEFPPPLPKRRGPLSAEEAARRNVAGGSKPCDLDFKAIDRERELPEGLTRRRLYPPRIW